MSCTDCFNGCGTPISDQCVKYTGPDIPLLGVSTGDPLSKLEQEIVDKLTEFSNGQGIMLSDIDLKCTYLEDLFGCCQDKTLVNLIQLLVDANCDLKTLIDNLQTTPYTFNVLCLTGLPASPTRDDILQAVINQLCALETTVDAIASDYVKASDLNTQIAAYLASTALPYYSRMAPYVAYEYYGSLAPFPGGAGTGLWDKVYICNGQTVGTFVTPDKRGRTAVGAVQGVPGGALDPAVDPTIPANAGTNYSIGQKWGSSYITLTTNQMPAHTHIASVSEVPHRHFAAAGTGSDIGKVNATTYIRSEGGTGDALYDLKGTVTTANVGLTSSTNTGVTVANSVAGLGQSHENRQPSIAAYYIMYIP